MSPSILRTFYLSFSACFVLPMLWSSLARMARADDSQLPVVSSDLETVYRKTETASSVAELTSIFDFCRNVIGDKTRSSDDRNYAKSLASWAANRRGEARSDQAGYLSQSQKLQEAAELDAQAKKDFEVAIQYDNTRWRAHHNLAIIHAVQGNNEAAVDGFSKVVALNPEFADAFFNRGEIYFRSNQFEAALKDYSQTIQLNPEDSKAYGARAHALFALGKTKDSLADYVKAMELAPQSVEAITEYADTCQALGKWKEAAEAYQRAMKADRQNVRVLQNAAWMMATCPDEYYRDGRTALAKAHEVIQASGSSPQTLDVLAAAQASAGDFASAQSTIAQAIQQTTEPSLRNEMMMRSKLYQRKKVYLQPNR